MTLYGKKTLFNLYTDASSLFTAVTKSCLLFYFSWNARSGRRPTRRRRSVRRSSAETGRGSDGGTEGRIASAASVIESSVKP